MAKIIAIFLSTFCWLYCDAQKPRADSTLKDTAGNNYRQKDVIDIVYSVFKIDASKRVDTVKIKPGRVYFSGAPAVAYSLQTGTEAVFTGSFALYTADEATTKLSSFLLDLDYTQKKQLITHLTSNVWSKDNKYDFIGDVRYLKYPSEIYGIGGHTTLNDAYTVDYNYLRFYQYVLGKISRDLYAGLGFQYDRHWGISEVDVATGRVTDFEKYGFSKTSTSTGISLNFLYNNIRNSINPEGGLYANVILRQNLSQLGSDGDWNSALVDIRKYVPLGHKGNILALWTYDWLTLSGNPPYLDLPSNGWDTYGNTGRGYIQGRFAGKKMVYLESEYRFGVTRNGLIGGVVFTNASSFTEFNNRFEVINPAAGLGIRIKFNKFSRTNAAIDYAIGKGGSKGVFVNMGEVF